MSTPQEQDRTSADDPSAAGDAAAAVRAILDEARRVAGSGPLLADKLEQLGIGPPETGRYSESAISNWIRGRTMPPADVLLAAAVMAGISVDERLLNARPATADPRETSSAMARMQAELDNLRSDVIELYGRLGYPMPRHERLEQEESGTQPTSATG